MRQLFKKHHDIGFFLIGVLKLFKGVALLLIGIGALSMVNHDLTETFKQSAHFLQIDLDRHFMQRLVAHVSGIDREDLKVVAWTSFIYSGLMLTEGIGLLYEKVWAEYMTFIITSSFIPWEGYKLVSHPTTARFTLIILNSIAAAYVAWRLHQRAMVKRQIKSNATPPPPASDQVYAK